MGVRKTHEWFVNKVYELVQNEYTILSEYIEAKIKIKMSHEKCKHEYMVTPSKFLNKKRCPLCFGTPKKTQKQFEKEVYDLVKDEYIILGEYKGTDTKIEMAHIKCGNTYMVTPYHFINKRRCPFCSGHMQKNTEIFKQEVFNLVGDEYEVLGEYIKSSEKIKIKHICGFEYEVLSNNFSRGNKCPFCSGLMKKTTEQFKEEVYSLVNNEYEVFGEYINTETKIEMAHIKCGNKYSVKPANFLSGKRCPFCKSSKCEKQISDYLKENNINYISQYKFDDCKNIFKLPFDFAIFDKDDNLICLIEYDGEQHFEIRNFTKNKSKNESNFNKTKINDKIKNDYCKANNITLIRIPYFQKSKIEEILNRRLNRLINN